MADIQGLTRKEERILKRKLRAQDGLTAGDVSAVAISGDYADLTGTPTLGTASTQDTSFFVQSTALNELVQDNLSTFLVAGTNITLTYNDPSNTLTIAASGGGGGYSSPLNAWLG